jgi:hypothetical protein
VLTYAEFTTDQEKHLSHQRLDDFDRIQIKSLNHTIDVLKKRKEALREGICVQGVALHANAIECLITIPGISIFGACNIMADIGNYSGGVKLKNTRKGAEL